MMTVKVGKSAFVVDADGNVFRNGKPVKTGAAVVQARRLASNRRAIHAAAARKEQVE